METPKLLSRLQVAKIVGCAERHVYRMADDGRLPKPLRIGGLLRWDESKIQQWIEDGCPTVDETEATK